MRGGRFGCAIGAAGGGAGGFPPGGCGGSFEVDVDGLEPDADGVPLGFRDDAGCTGGLVVEDRDVGFGEELEVFVLGGRAGAFPFDMGGVAV